MSKTRKGLTVKQETFAKALIPCHGNQTQAAIMAGYSPRSATVIASENLTKPEVLERVEELRALASAHLDLDSIGLESLVEQIAVMALRDKAYTPALRAIENLQRLRGLIVDRSQSVSVNIQGSQEHLAAMMAKVRQRAEEPLDVTPIAS